MDISKLQKSAINFLYIFVADNASVSNQIKRKKADQLNELTKLYRKNTEYTFKQLVDAVYSGIINRYGKTPQQILQSIYSVSAKPAGIGAIEDDLEAAKAVESMSVTVADDTGSKKKNIWKDIKDVIEWLVALLQKIFGSYKDPGIYSPKSDDWTFGNRPTYIPDSASSQSGMSSVIPVLAAGAIVYYLFNATKKTNKRRK
ncbi:MAG: hypothetical protein GX962_13495 [Epulopiscium sp.]|nr:hypothetical protein [Candidatus Epulonipiscium sp.]